MAPHSPLPPSTPVPTLATLDGSLTHLITVTEVTGRRVGQLEDRSARVEDAERSLRLLSLRVSGAALSISAARVASAVVAPARVVLAALVGTFFGSAAVDWAWLTLHHAGVLAGLP